MEAGIQLQGSEVKSMRDGGVQIKDAYAFVRKGEVYLVNMHIAPYGPAARDGHEPERERKLLLHKYEIDRLTGSVQEKGLTLVPTRVYFKNGRAKVEIALGRGKDQGDKRRDLKAKDQRREIDRALSERGIAPLPPCGCGCRAGVSNPRRGVEAPGRSARVRARMPRPAFGVLRPVGRAHRRAQRPLRAGERLLLAALQLRRPAPWPSPAAATRPRRRRSPGAEPFFLKATALGSYMLYGRARDYLARDSAGNVAPAADSGPNANWTVTVQGNSFRLALGDRVLSVDGAGRLVLTGAPGPGSQFSMEKASGCAPFPEIETGVTGAPSKGSTHLHRDRGLHGRPHARHGVRVPRRARALRQAVEPATASRRRWWTAPTTRSRGGAGRRAGEPALVRHAGPRPRPRRAGPRSRTGRPPSR